MPARDRDPIRPEGLPDHITVHDGDLPDGLDLGPVVAVDSETMGLRHGRDRLCLVQLSSGDGTAHLVKFRPPDHAGVPVYDCPNLTGLLGNPRTLKLFHFARFDVAALKCWLDVDCTPIWCTKIASKLVRTFTDKHGLKDICRDLIGVEISKQQQSSDWGADTLTAEQALYAASDVLYLHSLKAVLETMLIREGRVGLAEACFAYLPTRAALDLGGWEDVDVLSH